MGVKGPSFYIHTSILCPFLGKLIHLILPPSSKLIYLAFIFLCVNYQHQFSVV